MATGGGDEAAAQRILRITDIAQEPLEFLAPISGYTKVPFVSLEKAVEPLVDILPDVQSHAYVAKQRCKKPADGLSTDESASIMLYTMGWEPLDEFFRLPPLRESVHRGVKLDMSKSYTRGETIVWWGFSSCTTNVEVLQSPEFLGETGARTIFHIQCETARDIRKHSYFPDEDEVLLLAATQFHISGCLKQGDLRIVQLRETRAPHPLLQPVPIIFPASDIQPLEPQVTHAKLLKLKHENAELEKIIAEKKGETQLALSSKGLADKDMEIVAYYALQENETLTQLNLSSNQIGAEGAQHLSDALRVNKTLTELDLSYNKIGDQGAQHLSDALRVNKTLTTLNLGANEIGAKGAEYLTVLKKTSVHLKVSW